MADIFISYKREEQPAARKLADVLEKEGWSVWWDPKLRAGEHFDDVIEKALTDAKCVVVLWSKLSIKSRYVKDEAGYALKRDKLVPVSIDDVEPPFRFEGLHTERLDNWDGSDTASEFQKLVADIADIIGLPQSVRIDDSYGGARVVAVPPEFVPPSSVDAIVSEEDTSLVLGAEARLGDVKETHEQLIDQAVHTEPHTPGTVVVRDGAPLRFLAVIHDLENDPSWREEWIASALVNIFLQAEERKLHSIVLPMLGTLHGSLNKRRFVRLLKNALERTSLKHLDTIWLIVPTGTDREILEDLGIFGIDSQATGEARPHQESAEKPIAIAHIETGEQRGRSFMLTEDMDSVTIGRSRDCEWVIGDQYISRSHCRLKIEPIGNPSMNGPRYKFRLIDSGSSVGTIVNGTRVKRADLKNGDYFQIGGVRLKFELMDG